ncbi:MAG: GTPase [Cellulophaga sp.]
MKGDKDDEFLLFVYNASTGFGNSLIDSVHKIVSPETYACSLCGLTHGVFLEKREWKKFREASSIAMKFIHKDEFEKHYDYKKRYTFPVILLIKNGESAVFANSKKMNSFKDIAELIRFVKQKKA